MEKAIFIVAILGFVLCLVAAIVWNDNSFDHSGHKSNTDEKPTKSKPVVTWFNEWLSLTHSPTYE